MNGSHPDPIAPVILGVTGILLFAVIGRFTARKFNQPSVVGELLMGILLGNVGYWLGVDFIQILREGPSIFTIMEQTLGGTPLETAAVATLGPEQAKSLLTILHSENGPPLLQVAHTVDVFSRYGVIFLLFLVGLETNLEEMRRVGGESVRVALTGVVAPFVLGFVAARTLNPDLSLNGDLFVAAALGATRIGISASVLQDLGYTRSHAGRVILGAAVMDDILGLVLLTVVSGIVVSGGVQLPMVARTLIAATIFLGAAFWLSPYLIQAAVDVVHRLDIVEAKMFVSFSFVMVLAWFANFVGLATIVGAFAAGVILHDGFFRHWGDATQHRVTIRDLIMPLEVILVPIFFVLMGIEVKLETFLDKTVLVTALGLIVAAVLGKLAAGFGARRRSNRLAIGIGMIPRGEVGLIFASIGKSLGIINDALFAAVVLMVIVTTLAAPPLLKWAMGRQPVEPLNE